MIGTCWTKKIIYMQHLNVTIRFSSSAKCSQESIAWAQKWAPLAASLKPGDTATDLMFIETPADRLYQTLLPWGWDIPRLHQTFAPVENQKANDPY